VLAAPRAAAGGDKSARRPGGGGAPKRAGQRAARPPPPPARERGTPRTLLFCKPYDVLCQFTDATGGGGDADAPRATLKGAERGTRAQLRRA
jgi:hypothetical protein